MRFLILKAKYTAAKGATNGTVVLTAGKTAGTATVWLIELDPQGDVVGTAKLTVTVKGAAKKLVISEETELVKTENSVNSAKYELKAVTPVKNASVPANTETATTFGFMGYLADGKTIADMETGTYYVDDTYDKDMINVVVGTNYKISIDTKNKTKVGKTKVTLVHKQSGAKATFTVNVTNPVTALKTTLDAATEDNDQKLGIKGDKVTLKVVETKKITAADTTDKVKVYVVEPGAKSNNAYTAGLKVEKNAETGKYEIKCTTSKAVKAQYKEGVLTITRTDPFLDAQVWFVYTDAGTKVPYAIKAADIEGIVLEKAYVTGVGASN